MYGHEYEKLVTDAALIQDSCNRWVKSFTKKGKIEIHKKDEDIREHLITKEEAKEVQKGPSVKIICKLMRSTYNNKSFNDLTVNDFVFVRNFIIFYVFVFNSHRNGMIHQMLSCSFAKAQLKGNDRWQMKIEKHKTASETSLFLNSFILL